jgi:hypothetical protein
VTGLIDAIRSHVMALPDLAKFAVVVAAIVGVPRLAARLRAGRKIDNVGTHLAAGGRNPGRRGGRL